MDDHSVWVISADPDIRHLIGLNLSKRGFQATEVTGLDMPLSPWAKPDLIVLDVEPPDESGWATAEALRRRPWAQEVPLLLLLAAVPTTGQLAALQPACWVEKPLAMEALLTLVRETLIGRGEIGKGR